MALKNAWVGYVDRTYQQIKESVLTKFGIQLPEMTDHTESNPFVKFLSIWSGIAEHLNYYIDNAAREIFLPTSRQYKSAIKIASLFDYRIRGVKASSVDLTFYLDAPASEDIFIPIGTVVSTEDGIVFSTTRNGVVVAGTMSVVVPAKQVEWFYSEELGTSSGLKSQRFILTEDTEDSSVKVYVGGIAYTYKDTLAFSGPEDTVFTLSLNTDKVLELAFGNGIQGVIPNAGASIVVGYGLSKGSEGNLAESTITKMVTVINGLKVTNYNRASGGSDIESLEDLKKLIPLSIRTLRRAVTHQDYEDIANMVAGIKGSKVMFSCGKTVDVYVVPEGGGVASQSLLSEVESAFTNTKMITTNVRALAAGEVQLIMVVNVNVLPAFSRVAVELKVRNAIKNYVNVENAYIGGSTEIGNLYELVESIEGVDFSEIKLLNVVPFARITSGESVLNWTRELKPTSDSIVVWSLRYSSALEFELLKNGQYNGTYQIGTEINLPEIKMTINAGTYVAGDSWQFVTYPYNASVVLQEPSVAVLLDSNLTLNSIAVSASACVPFTLASMVSPS